MKVVNLNNELHRDTPDGIQVLWDNYAKKPSKVYGMLWRGLDIRASIALVGEKVIPNKSKYWHVEYKP